MGWQSFDRIWFCLKFSKVFCSSFFLFIYYRIQTRPSVNGNAVRFGFILFLLFNLFPNSNSSEMEMRWDLVLIKVFQPFLFIYVPKFLSTTLISRRKNEKFINIFWSINFSGFQKNFLILIWNINFARLKKNSKEISDEVENEKLEFLWSIEKSFLFCSDAIRFRRWSSDFRSLSRNYGIRQNFANFINLHSISPKFRRKKVWTLSTRSPIGIWYWGIVSNIWTCGAIF